MPILYNMRTNLPLPDTWSHPGARKILHLLGPAHTETTSFLENLNETSAKKTARLNTLGNKPAAEVVEDLAKGVAN
eukprot:909417-Pelagomonas_calceolata.AAC.1